MHTKLKVSNSIACRLLTDKSFRIICMTRSRHCFSLELYCLFAFPVDIFGPLSSLFFPTPYGTLTYLRPAFCSGQSIVLTLELTARACHLKRPVGCQIWRTNRVGSTLEKRVLKRKIETKVPTSLLPSTPEMVFPFRSLVFVVGRSSKF